MPDLRRALPVIAVTAPVLALTCTFLAFVALAIGLAASLEARTVVLLRGVLVLLAVLLICRAVVGRAIRRGVPDPVPVVLVAALLGYLLSPGTWAGRAALGQLVTDPGLVTALVDLVLWGAVALVAVAWGASRQQAPAVPATPYG